MIEGLWVNAGEVWGFLGNLFRTLEVTNWIPESFNSETQRVDMILRCIYGDGRILIYHPPAITLTNHLQGSQCEIAKVEEMCSEKFRIDGYVYGGTSRVSFDSADVKGSMKHEVSLNKGAVWICREPQGVFQVVKYSMDSGGWVTLDVEVLKGDMQELSYKFPKWLDARFGTQSFQVNYAHPKSPLGFRLIGNLYCS